MSLLAPIGAFIDNTHHKRLLLCIAIIGCTLSVVVVMSTNNLYIHIANCIFQGASFAILEPCKAAMTLGVTGPDGLNEASSKNEMAAHAGMMIIGGTAGIAAYFIYPYVEYIFLLSVICGLVGMISIMLIPSDAINHDLACNSAVKTNDEGVTKEVQVSSYLSVMKERNVFMFVVSIFLFHLANAAVLPLLGQMVGVGVEFRLGLPFIAGCMVMGEITGIFGAWLTLGLNNKFSSKFCMVLGISMLFPRCAAIVSVAMFGKKNIYALAATQLLDGFGGSMVMLTVIICINMLSVGTGRFGAIFGAVKLGETVGAALSNLLGGYLADRSFELAFAVLGGIAIFPVLTFMCGVDISGPEKKTS